MTTKQKTVILEAVKAAKGSEFGATAIKVELEAQFGREGGFDYAPYCHNWIMGRLESLGLATQGEVELSHGDDSEWGPVLPLTYAEFYRDGSVDSEFTFTIMLDNPENIFLLPKIIKVFTDLGEANGNGIDVRGAGMHMAFLKSPDGDYPTYSSASDRPFFHNFEKSMTLLMPALYFLGTSNEISRGLGFRQPGVGFDNHRTAVDYRGGALEFRVFDTCYNQPEAILDNFVVMSRALRYWTSRHVPCGLEKITTELRFGKDRGDSLERFYSTYTHIDLLNQGLVRLKPSYYTIREVKLQRKFEVTKKRLDAQKVNEAKQAEVEYAEYEDRFTWQLMATRAEQLYRYAHEELDRGPSASPQLTQAEQALAIEARVDEYVKAAQQNKKSIKRYIRDKMQEFEENNRGEYSLSV